MKNTLPFLILVCLLSSCRSMFAPVMQNAVILEEKKELEVSANNNNIQAAYAISDKIGVMVNGHYRLQMYEEEIIQYRDYYRKQSFMDFAAGYSNNFNDEFKYSLFAGGGIGFIDNGYEDYTSLTGYEYYKANSTRLFIQPNAGYTSKFGDFIFSARLNGHYFKNLSVTDNYYDSDDLQTFLFAPAEPYHFDDQFYLFLDPAFTFRFGYKFLKFHTQVQYTVALINSTNYQPIHFNAGITLELAPRHFKKKEN